MKQFYYYILICVLAIANSTTIRAYNNSVAPVAMKKVYIVEPNTSGEAVISLINYGDNDVYNFKYSLEYNDQEIASGVETLKQKLAPKDSYKFIVPFSINKVNKPTFVRFIVYKVNDDLNGATFNYTDIPVFTVSQMPKRRVVVEDYTGMWCQNCPRGIAIMQRLSKYHNDDFIGIAIHTGYQEPLKCEDYRGIASRVPGVPYVDLNRKVRAGSYKGDSEFEEQINEGTFANLDVFAQWDKETNNINVTSQTTFLINPENKDYALGYVLVEDSMKRANFYQYNNAHERERGHSEEYDWWINAPGIVYGTTFNHVAIAAKGVEKGLDNSIDKNFVIDKPLMHNVVFSNINQYTKSINRQNMSICAFIYDRKNNYIINANKCKITAFSETTGINRTKQSNNNKNVKEIVARYTINGKLIVVPTKGVNIIKYNDGSVEKQIIK